MKVFLTAVICGLLLLGSMVIAEERPSIWGYVYEDEDPVCNASVYIYKKPSGPGATVYTDSSGYYVHLVGAGIYFMEAWKGQKNDLIPEVKYDGGAGGKQVDFHLTYDPK